MVGYSGTPLPKKLGLKPGYRVAFIDLPPDVKTELRSDLSLCQFTKDGHLDFAMIFAKDKADLKKQLSGFAKQLAPAGMLWVNWPKKSSGVSTDLDENVIRAIGLDAGLVDIKVCAVTTVWSGLKFVIPVKNPPKAKS